MNQGSLISSSKLQEIHEIFRLFDRDNSGSISPREMRDMFDALDIEATDDELRQVIHQIDTDGDGQISFQEFVKLIGNLFYTKQPGRHIVEAFEFYDTNKNGYIDAHELQSVLKSLGRVYARTEVERMIQLVDANGDGRISLSEFFYLFNAYN